MTTQSGRSLFLALAGACLFAGGFLLGRIVGPEEMRPPGTPIAMPVERSTPDLTAAPVDLDPLQMQLEDLRAEIRNALHTPSPAAPAEAAQRLPVDDATPWDQLMARLQRIEALQRQLITRAAPTLAVPRGTSIRDFFIALKNSDNGDDVSRAHHLWTYAQVQSTYGPPDVVEEREDYIEWIYKLGEDEQFDFHFVKGLCVLAH